MFNNSGTINLSLTRNEAGFSNSGTFNNSGTINMDDTCSTGCSDTYMSNSGTFNNRGTLNITRNPGGGGDFTNSGTLNNAGGTLSNNVTSTIYNTGIINNTSGGSNLNNFGTLTNYGTFNNMSGANLMNAGTINNAGIFANSGAVTISSSGLFTTSTNYTQTAGSTVVDGTLTAISSAIVNIQGGILSGTGTINGDVEMAGTMMPGALGTPGTLTIFGNYEQTGTGILEELMGPLSHSFLDVSGNVSLDSGAFLDITLLDGYDPFEPNRCAGA
jgi:fibronectin-binding autotransporter adhesin